MTSERELKLVEKLKLIETLFAGAATEGERGAAASARDRILERLESCSATEEPVEYKFTLSDMWTRKLFVALLRRYGIQPYRYKRQRHTTVMAKVPKTFVDTTLWPQFQELSSTLKSYLNEVTERVISDGVFEDSSEARVVEQQGLPF